MSGRNTMKQASSSGKSKNKNKNKRSKAVGYERYIYKVMKEVNPKLEISLRSMVILNHFMQDMAEKIVETSKSLLRYSGRRTLTSMDMHRAVKMELPGQLAKHAMAEGAKAVIRFSTH
ncbi:histone H2B.2-like [Solanum lycopersicum]|uniref:histone H2B.2-like n=1 Tax=Solanum lycopersicum TaxID=4081 RepID=UPI000276AC60|nr:histone H2B.2-like [Solanum lycopersicum]